MTRRTEFIPYRPKAILNKSKRPDHWFWTRYSAYPYTGCQHGCKFCYCRERKFCPNDDPEDFSYIVKVKENASQLLQKALQRAPVDMVFTGDYQPAERKFQLSRKILEVLLEAGFPAFVLSRSPLVLRDLDLFQKIQEHARSVVAFSVIYTPDSPDAERLRRTEGLAPTPEKRFAAMEKLAAAGILTGTCFMPALPILCDNDANLEAVVRWTANHGGQFVLSGGLTLADQQKEYFFRFLNANFPELTRIYQSMYPPESYGTPENRWLRTAQRLRELCAQYHIYDRIPRPIIPGDRRTLNKRIVEFLANEIYGMEIFNKTDPRLWSYRKAAWAIEDLDLDIGLVYRQMGLKGLQSIPGIGASLGSLVERLVTHYPGQSFLTAGNDLRKLIVNG